MKTRNLYSILILLTIFSAGLFLRLYRLNLNLPPLYADETGQYFVLQRLLDKNTGIFERLKNIAFSYTWFLGFNPLGVRLPSAIYGSILTVLGYFWVVYALGGKKNLGIVLAVLFALSPWSFMISRIGHTHIPSILILVCIFVPLYLKANSVITYATSLAPILLASVYYPSVIFVLPFIFVPLFVGFVKLVNIKNRLYFKIGLVFFLTILAFIISTNFKIFEKSGRGFELAIWRDINTPWEIDKFRALSWNSDPTFFSFYLPPEQFANKLVYNRVVANISVFAKNYFSFFSPDWLFFKGDDILRHSTGQVGAFYPFLIPFMIYGAYVFFNTADKKTKQLFLIWILASPIPAAITKDGAGYVLRVVTMLPFLTYFCALGLVESFSVVKRLWRIPYGILLGLVALYSAYYFFYGYFHVYPSLSARSYEFGFKELSDFQVASGNSNMLVLWDGHYHNNDFRFWQATPFNQHSSFRIKEIVVGQSHFSHTYQNLYFGSPKSLSDLQDFLRQNTVNYLVLPDRYFLNYPVEIDQNYATPSTIIKYPDQTPALKIFNLSR